MTTTSNLYIKETCPQENEYPTPKSLSTTELDTLLAVTRQPSTSLFHRPIHLDLFSSPFVSLQI